MGWIKLERSLLNHYLWQEKPFSAGQAWVDLLLLANHDDRKFIYKGEVITSGCGNVDRSITWLASRWGWSRNKTRNYLKALEGDEMLTVKATIHRTTITIENYSFFQGKRTINETTKGQQKDSKGTVRGHRQEYKELKNIKNNNRVCLSDVELFVTQNNLNVEPQEFFDYYESQDWTKANGQPVKNWKACARQWHRRNSKGEADNAEKKAARAKRLKEIEEQIERERAEMNEKAQKMLGKVKR